MCDAGDDPTADANFETDTARTIGQKLKVKMDWTEEFLSRNKTVHESNGIFTKIFHEQLNQCLAETMRAYRDGKLKLACYWIFFELENLRKRYEQFGDIDTSLMYDYIHYQAVLMAPITPFFAQEVKELIGNDRDNRSIFENLPVYFGFPNTLGVYDQHGIDLGIFYGNLWGSVKTAIRCFKGTPKCVTVKFVRKYPEWYYAIGKILETADFSDSKDVMKTIAIEINKQKIDRKDRKIVMSLVKESVQQKSPKLFQANSVDLQHVEEVCKRFSEILEIPIHHEIEDQCPHIIQDKPEIKVS